MDNKITIEYAGRQVPGQLFLEDAHPLDPIKNPGLPATCYIEPGVCFVPDHLAKNWDRGAYLQEGWAAFNRGAQYEPQHGGSHAFPDVSKPVDKSHWRIQQFFEETLEMGE